MPELSGATNGLLTYEEFTDCIQQSIPRFAQHWLNPSQNQGVRAEAQPPTFIVAGPGTGKTTVLALRVLKLILVDDVPPSGVIATTFTRKAASELRSRILAWGYAAVSYARLHTADPVRLAWLADIDVNAIRIGTLDSLSEDFLAACRPPGGITPATIEGFLSTAIMRRYGLFPNGRHNNQNLESFISTFVSAYPGARPFRVKLRVALSFADRVRHDCVDLPAFAASGLGQSVLSDILSDYFSHLENHYFADFGRLEQLLHAGLLNNTLGRVTDGIRAILVDEFQDTNYLQEQIYFEMCRITQASLTVVGDDDQSIFRFRGATVELFAAFASRIVTALGDAWQPQRVDLVNNYRSAAPIVALCNTFVNIDATYQAARVPGKLPLVVSANHSVNDHPPVLGMFRTDCETLANDLTEFLVDVFRRNGRTVTCNGHQHLIIRSPQGDFGDAVLLSRSANEFSAGDVPRARLPLLLRNELEGNYHVPVFNPRGRSLYEIDEVRRLLGLALLCIDPTESVLQSITNISPTVRSRLQVWRTAAAAFSAANPAPGGLAQFVHNWQTHVPGNMPSWPSEWPLLELFFTLVTWMPMFQTDPEGQVYLEAIARTVSEAGQFSSYGARLLFGQGIHDVNSVKAVIREVFEIIANGDAEVDEEIMPYVPRSYFPIMTIHQAKGLEFPLVIIDVGSDFRTNNVQQRRFRCPETPDEVHMHEEIVAPFCPIGAARTQRHGIDRAWDDLRRLYYVAFSRPENVLLMVGLTSQLGTNPRVRSVATGDAHNGVRGLGFSPTSQCAAGDIALI